MAATDHRLAAALRARLAQERLAARLAAALRRYFGRQASHAVFRYLIGAAPIPDDAADRLLALLDPHVRSIVRAADTVAAMLVGAHPDPEDVYRLRVVMGDVASRARAMTQETRDAVRATVAEGVARGYHPSVIARGKPSEGFRGLRSVVEETYRNRADTIARTETALVWNRTTTDRFGRSGVRTVRVHDGAGCGWTSHRDPDAADGSIRTLAEAEAHPISHPNCRRAFAPVVERGVA